MRKRVHKITLRLAFSGFFGLLGFLFYGVYVMWTRDNTDVTRTELNLIITYLAAWVTMGLIAMFTDDFFPNKKGERVCQ